MQQRERGSIEARLATLRLGLFTIASLIIGVLVALTGLIYVSLQDANDASGAEYSFGDYMGAVGPVIIPSILIIFIAALAINFGYSFYLRNQADK